VRVVIGSVGLFTHFLPHCLLQIEKGTQSCKGQPEEPSPARAAITQATSCKLPRRLGQEEAIQPNKSQNRIPEIIVVVLCALTLLVQWFC